VANFGRWEFTCDRPATVDAYARADQGGSDSCTCNGCRNFVAARTQVYPQEFLSLLDSLGIDSRRDGEVYLLGPAASGRYYYGGWFHFVGSLEKTGDFPAVTMGPGFTVYLCRRSAPALKSLIGLPLVQVEFHSNEVPWVLSEPKPE
jgi:hypothetical protein